MMFYIALAVSVFIGLWCVKSKRAEFLASDTKELSEHTKNRRKVVLRKSFCGGFFFTALITGGVILITAAATQNMPDTVVKSDTFVLSPLGSSDVYVVSDGTHSYDRVSFRLENHVDAVKATNFSSSIHDDLLPLGKPHVVKMKTRTLKPWMAPFPLGGSTRYEIHVAPQQVAGGHLITVR